MKKISIVIVSALTFVSAAFFVGCQNPASVSSSVSSNSQNENNNTGLNLPNGIEDDIISYPFTLIPLYNSSTNEYTYELLVNVSNVYPDVLEYVVIENPDNLNLSNTTFGIWEGNITASHASAQYSLLIKLPTSAVTSNHTIVIGIKNVTRNFTYGQQWSDPNIRSYYYKTITITPNNN